VQQEGPNNRQRYLFPIRHRQNRRRLEPVFRSLKRETSCGLFFGQTVILTETTAPPRIMPTVS
jgi:hypothetical protein